MLMPSSCNSQLAHMLRSVPMNDSGLICGSALSSQTKYRTKPHFYPVWAYKLGDSSLLFILKHKLQWAIFYHAGGVLFFAWKNKYISINVFVSTCAQKGQFYTSTPFPLLNANMCACTTCMYISSVCEAPTQTFYLGIQSLNYSYFSGENALYKFLKLFFSLAGERRF